jgi:hypothetical protein
MPNEPHPTTPETPNLPPPTAEENLLEEYLELVERHGLNSEQARTFREEHKGTQGFAELIAEVNDLEKSRRQALWARRVVAGVWATAAVLVAVIGWVAVQRAVALAASHWGLNQPDALDALETSPSPSAYLKGLAKVAGEGADRLPQEPIPLAQRITEYRLGCTRLLYADKRPLGAKEKEELNSLCRRWSEHLDNALEKLDRRASATDVSAEVDATIKGIVANLQARAGELEAAQAPNAWLHSITTNYVSLTVRAEASL